MEFNWTYRYKDKHQIYFAHPLYISEIWSHHETLLQTNCVYSYAIPPPTHHYDVYTHSTNSHSFRLILEDKRTLYLEDNEKQCTCNYDSDSDFDSDY